MDLDKLFALKKPCANCPFLKEGAIELQEGRVEGIIKDMTTHDDRPFMCHKTLDNETQSYCTGAMIYLEKVRRPNIAMRIGNMLKMYTPHKVLEFADKVIDP